MGKCFSIRPLKGTSYRLFPTCEVRTVSPWTAVLKNVAGASGFALNKVSVVFMGIMVWSSWSGLQQLAFMKWVIMGFPTSSSSVSKSWRRSKVTVKMITQKRKCICNLLLHFVKTHTKTHWYRKYKSTLKARESIQHVFNYMGNDLFEEILGGNGHMLSDALVRVSFKVKAPPTGRLEYPSVSRSAPKAPALLPYVHHVSVIEFTQQVGARRLAHKHLSRTKGF